MQASGRSSADRAMVSDRYRWAGPTCESNVNMSASVVYRSPRPLWFRWDLFGSLVAFLFVPHYNTVLASVVLAAGTLVTCGTAYIRGRRARIQCQRKYAGRCTACGYDLTGNVSGRCPECGTEITEVEVVEDRYRALH